MFFSGDWAANGQTTFKSCVSSRVKEADMEENIPAVPLVRT